MKISSLLLVALALLTAACSSNPEKEKGEPAPRDSTRPGVFEDRQDPLAKRREDRRLAQLDAEQLYKRARSTLDSSDFQTAIENYDLLSTRYPFSDYATQGELERLYALYRSFEPDRASSAADRFLREHPRHPAVDYVHYIKGLVNFDRDEAALNLLPSDESKSDVTSQRRAFDDFALLIQKFPNSKYAGDAHARMIYIRNRLATHELHVVDFYVRRGAYVAAAKRAEQVIAQYPGTPASYRALAHLVECYELAGLKQQADDARRLLAAQDAKVTNAVLNASTSQLPTLSVSAAPPALAQVAAAPAAAAPAEKPGLMSRIAGFFSPLDTSERPIEIIIPTAKAESAAASAPTDGAATAAAATPAAEAASPTADAGASADPNAVKLKQSTKLEVFFEPYDAPAKPAEAAKPETKPEAATP